MSFNSRGFGKSVSALKRDKRFAHLIKKHGAPAFKWSNFERGDAFQSLCRSIIYQQVSGAAAATILSRFIALFPKSKFPALGSVYKIPIEKMRSAGLSSQKASYIKDLALKFSDGTIKHTSLNEMTNDEIVKHLTQIKGIGSWTVHMFLIFTLNRSDVLPTGDLGIRKGFQMVYGLKKLPDHAKMERRAKPWRAHASSASWYFWRVADEAKTKALPESKAGDMSSRGGSSFGGKSFKQKVLDVVSKIPKGETLSYKEVAGRAGNAGACRAVGNILNKNHDPRVPCHRVVRSGWKPGLPAAQSLAQAGGYNRGVKKKIQLLKKEGASAQIKTL